jgi:hypothetical protein
MTINVPTPRPPQPPSATALAADVLDSIGMAVRLARLTAARHEVAGCPAPGDCPPCAAEVERRHREDLADYHARDAAWRREAIAQHRVSAARLAQRPVSPRVARFARDMALAEATRRIGGAGARCVVCRVDHADGSKSCRSCGAETTDDDIGPFLDVLNGRRRPPGLSRGARGTGGRVVGAGDQQRPAGRARP